MRVSAAGYRVQTDCVQYKVNQSPQNKQQGCAQSERPFVQIANQQSD